MNDLHEKLLAEARRIGDKLISQATHHPVGISWLSAVVTEEKDYTLEENANLYNGTSGIAIFLAELYRTTKEVKYLEAAKQAMLRAETLAQSKNYYSLLTGTMSVPFALLRLYEVTGQNEYLARALALTKSLLKDVHHTTTIYEVLNGLSGTVLCLLKLHQASNDAEILKLIDTLTGKLLAHIQPGKQGICWDRCGASINGLCGFSHGAAGIGYTFLELGHYLKNDAFYWIADQAFYYEQLYYNEGERNWKDLRRGVYDREDEFESLTAYKTGDLDFFTEGDFMNAWCHGAAGIGLSRIRAYELTGRSDYLEQVHNAIMKTKETNLDSEKPASFTLCHGHGGNAEIFLEGYRVLKDERYMKWALSIAERGIEAYGAAGYYAGGSVNREEDVSLFLGISGIGYFYLRVLDAANTPSILAPRLHNIIDEGEIRSYPSLSISLHNLQRRVIEQVFPRTLRLLEEIRTEETQLHIKGTSLTAERDILRSWVGFVTSRSNLRKDEALLLDAFHLELTKWKMSRAIRSNSLLFQKAAEKVKDAYIIQSLKPADLLEHELVLDEDMLFYFAKWNWSDNKEEFQIKSFRNEEDEYYLLLIPKTSGHIEEISLSPFSYRVMCAFEKPTMVLDAVNEVLSEFEELSAEQTEDLQTRIVEQIYQAVISGFLIDPRKHSLAGLEKRELVHAVVEL